MGSNSYYTLIASLPNLPPHFDVERQPISALRLRQRLTMLEPDDARILARWREFLIWERQPVDVTDEEVVQHCERILREFTHPLMRELADEMMDFRTILSALRRRRMGLGPPPGVGSYTGHIARFWQQPQFNLGRRFPWIEVIAQLLDEDHPLKVQTAIFDLMWDHFSRLAEEYTFSFEAVVLYVARWEVIYRWTSRDAELGGRKFDQLVTETLGEYANLYP